MEDLKELGIKKYNFKVDYKKKEEDRKKDIRKRKRYFRVARNRRKRGNLRSKINKKS